METKVSAQSASSFVAATKFFHDIKTLCYENCVVDFQTADIGAMEKECARQCIQKQMTIYKDL